MPVALEQRMLMYPSSEGPFCQSCGMPLAHRYDFGTGADGRRVNDYCHFCFDHGQFTDPDLTVGDMIEQSVDFLTRQTLMAEAEARAWVGSQIPALKRWQIRSEPPRYSEYAAWPNRRLTTSPRQ